MLFGQPNGETRHPKRPRQRQQQNGFRGFTRLSVLPTRFSTILIGG